MEIKHGPPNVCRCCAADSSPLFGGLLLGDKTDYFDCSVCGYVQTESPCWLKKAYSSDINNCDEGVVVSNQANVGLVLATLTALKQINGRVVDCAGVYGILVRLLHGRGIDALLTNSYCKNLLAVGFERTAEKADLVTAFEPLEHFLEPALEAEKLFSISPNLLISTTLITTSASNEWWYYGLDRGQHIGFFRLQTLQIFAKKIGKHFMTDGVESHFFSNIPISSISSMRWNLNVCIAQLLPFLYGRKLESKVWIDFEKMSNT